MELTEKTLERSIIYEGKVFTAAKDSVELQDGSRAFRELVLHRGGAGVLPVSDDGTVTLVRQYRAGAARPLTEICAGKLEEGEDPRDCAARELSEELGFEADEMIPLGFFFPTPAYDSERTYLFLARGLHNVGAHPDKGEFIERVSLPFGTALKMAANGELTDGKTVIALYRAESYGKA